MRRRIASVAFIPVSVAIAVVFGACGGAPNPPARPHAPEISPASSGTSASSALSASSTSPPATPALPAASSRDALRDLAWIVHAEEIRIDRSSGGLIGGWSAHYDLTRRGEVFLVTATNLSAHNGFGPDQPVSTRGIILVLKAGDVESWLFTLATATPRAPAKLPRVIITTSDRYDVFRIAIEAGDGCSAYSPCARRHVEFVSPATGDNPEPWFVWSGEHPVEIEPLPVSASCARFVQLLKDSVLLAP